MARKVFPGSLRPGKAERNGFRFSTAALDISIDIQVVVFDDVTS